MSKNSGEIKPICRAEIDLSALQRNLSILSQCFGQGSAVCMLKANAYGHGATKVAEFLEKVGVRWFGVATVDEGIELREAGIRSRILIMSGSASHFLADLLCRYKLTPMVSTADEIQMIAQAAPEKISVHFDVDTGMSRGGALPKDLTKKIFDFDNVAIEGISTHFARADSKDCDFSRGQLDVFGSAIKSLCALGAAPKYVHVDKSASILNQISLSFRREIEQEIPNVEFLMRCGLSLYGIDPRERFTGLQPVLKWRAPIVLRKRIPVGTLVGYDGTFIAKRETELALVRVGYADGLKRQLSNQGSMYIASARVPIVGRVSMDLTTLDVTDLVERGEGEACEVGNFAYIIGPDEENGQSAWDLARACDTIPYEILTSISGRVQRFYD